VTTTSLDASITAVRHWLIHMPFHRRQQSASSRRSGATRLVVEITTDAGVTGYGESICLLVQRSIRTIHVRMGQSCTSPMI